MLCGIEICSGVFCQLSSQYLLVEYMRYDLDRLSAIIIEKILSEILKNCRIQMKGGTVDIEERTVEELSTHLNNTYELVSKVAYLIGVALKAFEGNQTLQLSWFRQMEQDRNARVIRNLCRLRTILFRRYKQINTELYYNLKNLNTLPEYIPEELLTQLSTDGIEIIHVNWTINQYIVQISEDIKNNIAQCRSWFPIWLSWEYIREMFLIPKIRDQRQLKAVWGYYTNHLENYPYQMFISCRASEQGNILFNDEKFVTFLYGMHGIAFEDRQKLKDASDYTKGNIHSFIEHGDSVAVIVDCENANLFKLYSLLERLDRGAIQKIKKIILYNDIHTSTAWALLNRFTTINVEHKMVDRIKEDKSLVDMKLAVGTCRQYYENHIESFVLVSSDSDYWGLITELSECRFMVALEYEKTSGKIIEAMKEKGVAYCYIDDFCSGNLEPIQSEALLLEIRSYLRENAVNVEGLLQNALNNTRIHFTDKEVEGFKKRYLSRAHVVLDNNKLTIEL